MLCASIRSRSSIKEAITSNAWRWPKDGQRHVVQSHMLTCGLLLGVLIAAPPAPFGQPPVDAPAVIIDDQPLASDAGLEAWLADAGLRQEAALLAAPDFRAILADPPAHRGGAFRLSTGPATRVAARAFGIDGLSAWQFASPDIDEPVLLLIHEPQGTMAPGDRVADITIAAVFHRTALARVRRSGARGAIGLDDADAASEQRVLVFVGANPVYAAVAAQAWRGWSGAVVAVATALVLLWLARLLLVRRRALAKPRAAALPESEHWNDADLPPEPADALAELRRRAGDTMTHER